MQRKNRGEGTSLPMGELVKDPAALARLAQSGEARQLMQMMDRLLNTREGAELVERISRQAKESGLS